MTNTTRSRVFAFIVLACLSTSTYALTATEYDTRVKSSWGGIKRFQRLSIVWNSTSSAVNKMLYEKNSYDPATRLFLAKITLKNKDELEIYCRPQTKLVEGKPESVNQKCMDVYVVSEEKFNEKCEVDSEENLDGEIGLMHGYLVCGKGKHRKPSHFYYSQVNAGTVTPNSKYLYLMSRCSEGCVKVKLPIKTTWIAMFQLGLVLGLLILALVLAIMLFLVVRKLRKYKSLPFQKLTQQMYNY